ncbi:MAG: hypothetical protein AUG49_19320 [Catenulispora sp. 13_1_20CM_3_70_7]|nr:MAG: hypothetical protein AUG49_19320 [Catenulispora sp. 13_1_20CM_3_70_7]
MDLFSWLWLAWAVAFAVIEGTAIAHKDRPGRPATLSAHIWWLVRGAGPWHHLARLVLATGLAWLVPHLLGGPL